MRGNNNAIIVFEGQNKVMTMLGSGIYVKNFHASIPQSSPFDLASLFPVCALLGKKIMQIMNKNILKIPSGLTCSQKRKLERLRAKESKEREAEKYLMTHICSTRHHKRGGHQRLSK
jgi:hypothetical protein